MLYVIIDRCTITGSNCHQTFMGSYHQVMVGCNCHRAMMDSNCHQAMVGSDYHQAMFEESFWW